MSPQLTDADIARHDASAGKVLTDADIAARDRNPQGYLSQVGTGLWNTVKGLYQVGTELSSVGADPLNAVEHLKNLKRMVVDPQVDQAIKAADEWKKGNHSEAVGHALAAVLPGVGPAAANIGEKLGNLDYTGAAADATVLGATIAAPKVAGAVADVAPRVAAGVRVVGTGIKAAAPEVATGTAVAGVGELVGHVVPGAEWATRLAGGQLMRSGVAKGLKAAREAMGPREAPAAAAEAAAPAAVPTPAINVNRPLQLPPGPIITPAPADTSYVRSVPAEYPPTFELTPSEQALADHILQNVEPPQPAPPPPPPPPAEPPASPGSLNPPAAAKPTSAEIAAQLEASMRAETLTDYLTRKQIPAAMVENFGPDEWRMIAQDAGTRPPSPEDIQAIRGNLAQYDAAAAQPAEVGKMSPADAEADFQQRRATRRPAPEKAPEPDTGAQLEASLAAVKAGERPLAQLPEQAPRAATAAEKRVEAFAQHFAADPSIATADIEPLMNLPGFSKLGRALDIQGSLAAGEPARVVARVKELRGEAAAAPPVEEPPATIEPDVQSTPTIGQPTGEQPASAGAPVSGPREPKNPVARGSATSVRVPGEKNAYEGQYAVRELDDVHASHNAHTFAKNPNYQLRNDRDYSNPVNKERIVVNSKGDTFDPAYVLADSPDATNGAPVIDADGNVLGGNSRAMILDRVYKNNPAGADAYKAELARKVPQLGIDPEQIAGMKRPVLVRELSDSKLNKQRAITDLNKTGTASLTPEEQATADARMMTPGAADYLANALDSEGADATLMDVLSSNRGPGIVNRLIDDGVFTRNDRPKLIDQRTKVVTAAGKERIAKMLLGQAFEDSDQMGRTPAEIKNKLERAVSPIMQSSQKRGFDIRPTVREALDVLEQARMHDVTQMSDLVAQEGMFADMPQFSKQAIELAQFLKDSNPTKIGQAFRRYVANADPTFFGESTPAEAFADAFRTEPPPATLRKLMQPAETPAVKPRKPRSKKPL